MSVYSGAKMAEEGGIYVDLRDEFAIPDPNAPVMLCCTGCNENWLN